MRKARDEASSDAVGPGAGEHAPEREQVLAFRLASHHLARRLRPGSLLEAAAACGVQNTPPGSAALALQARVTGLSPATVDRALAEEKTLLQVWSLRAAPYILPTADAAVFTTGLLPDDEESRRSFITGAESHLESFGWTARQAVRRVAAALPDVLGGRQLSKDELSAELAARLAVDVPAELRALWSTPDGLTRYGETVVRFALYIVALQGALCMAPRLGNVLTLVLTDDWLGRPLPEVEPRQARAELVRRYLRCYGPSTPAHLAQWAGISRAQAQRAWQLIAHELVAVLFAGRRLWLRSADMPLFQSPPAPGGIRLLPPHDPYLLLRDRATLLPDEHLHRLVWRSAGNPGAVLSNGELAGIWRPHKAGERMRLTVTPFTVLVPWEREGIAAEAAALAPYWSCTTVEVGFEEIP